MAAAAPDDHAVVISVVYDGPPLAGKTTSVQALARIYGRPVHTPELVEGRTAYFDWMEYTGGRFQGAPIRCEIASVPGQRRWVRRRAHFLDRADVVVFVGDTRAKAWPATLDHLGDLRRRLDARSGPPVGLVFQANHRDAPGAVPLEVIRAACDDAHIALVESTAHLGAGVREAFVLAVRVALERVREMRQHGDLVTAGSVLGNPDDTYALLQRLDQDDPAMASAPERGAPASAAPPASDAPPGAIVATSPGPPWRDVPTGFVWRPVEGRIILAELERFDAPILATAAGDWVADVGDDWRAHSWRDAVYQNLDHGRAALVEWARWHAHAQQLLSTRRCILLSRDAGDTWRLWQLVRRAPTLRSLQERHGASVALGHLNAASRRLLGLGPCTIDNVGFSDGDLPRFVGWAPPPPPSVEVAE